MNIQLIDRYKIVLALLGTTFILVCWRGAYPYSCAAWFFPVLIFLLIAYGQFEYLMRTRKCRADCLFNSEAWIYAWATRKPFVVIYGLVLAVPLSLSLVSFAALAGLSDAIFILIASLLTGLLYVPISRFSQKYVAPEMQLVMSKRWVVFVSMCLMLPLYSYVSYVYVDVPLYLDPVSVKNTMNQASQQVASLCSVSNIFLKWMQELDAAGWYWMFIGSKQMESQETMRFLWLIFFINHAIVFSSLARVQVEVIAWGERLISNKITTGGEQ